MRATDDPAMTMRALAMLDEAIDRHLAERRAAHRREVSRIPETTSRRRLRRRHPAGRRRTRRRRPPRRRRATSKPGWVRRLWPYLMRHRRNLQIALGGALVGSAAQAVVPLIERQIVDNVILQPPLAAGARGWRCCVGLGVLTFVAAHFRRYRGGRVALDVQYDLRNEMYEHLHSLDFADHDQMPTGQLVGRANSDSTLVQGLLSFFPIMSGNVLLMLASLAIMLVLSPLLARRQPRSSCRPCSSSPTGCVCRSSRRPGTASRRKARSPRSSTRTSTESGS